MIPYFLLFVYFGLGALLYREHGNSSPPPSPMIAIGGIIIAVMVGFRWQVGGDWLTYELYFNYAGYADLSKVLKLSDPGYQVLNWVVQHAGAGIWGVNLICGILFSWGLIRFSRVQSNPWLAIVVAVPYLVIVVAMGYSRQAVALGFLMAGLASMSRGGSLMRFCAYAAAAALFHRTAVLAIPIVIFATERGRLLNAIAGAATFILLYDALLANDVDALVDSYIVAEYSSQGALIRVLISLVPAALFLANVTRFSFPLREERIWRFFSYSAILLAVLLTISPSTTAVDRMALYVIPLQLAVLSRVPIAFSGRYTHILVIMYSLMIQIVWLNFATHAKLWLPYRVSL